MGALPSPGARRPTQQRGQARVDRILDAAAELIARSGTADLSLAEVARRSRTATGSLYHFFPNREALVEALVDRHLARIRTLSATLLDTLPDDAPIGSLIDRIVTSIAQFAQTAPELPALIDRMLERTAEVDVVVFSGLGARFARRAPQLAPAERQRIVRMTVELVRAGIRQFLTAPPSERAAVLDEVRMAARAYLERRLGAAEGAQR